MVVSLRGTGHSAKLVDFVPLVDLGRISRLLSAFILRQSVWRVGVPNLKATAETFVWCTTSPCQCFQCSKLAS